MAAKVKPSARPNHGPSRVMRSMTSSAGFQPLMRNGNRIDGI
jgi:hypothetical protein